MLGQKIGFIINFLVLKGSNLPICLDLRSKFVKNLVIRSKIWFWNQLFGAERFKFATIFGFKVKICKKIWLLGQKFGLVINYLVLKGQNLSKFLDLRSTLVKNLVVRSKNWFYNPFFGAERFKFANFFGFKVKICKRFGY